MADLRNSFTTTAQLNERPTAQTCSNRAPRHKPELGGLRDRGFGHFQRPLSLSTKLRQESGVKDGVTQSFGMARILGNDSDPMNF
jgi:hypothetical protein